MGGCQVPDPRPGQGRVLHSDSQIMGPHHGILHHLLLLFGRLLGSYAHDFLHHTERWATQVSLPQVNVKVGNISFVKVTFDEVLSNQVFFQSANSTFTSCGVQKLLR